MLPMILDVKGTTVGLLARGREGLGRLAILEAAGPAAIRVFSDYPTDDFAAAAGDRLERRWPTPRDIAGCAALFIGDLAPHEAREFVLTARALRTPVNTEDVKPLCDFHVPAMVRRGELILTISTGGASPRLAKRLRETLEDAFGPEWAERLELIAAARARWREEGASFAELNARTDAIIDAESWLPKRGATSDAPSGA